MDQGVSMTQTNEISTTATRQRELRFRIGPAEVPYAVGGQAAAALERFLLTAIGRDAGVAIVHDPAVAGFVESHLVPVVSACTARRPLLVPAPASEAGKRLATVERLADRLWDLGLRHDGAVIAVGGGITLNVAGLTAALFLRGVPLVSVPTTLLAAVDGVVSAKQGVNSGRVRNGLGCYTAAALVVAPLDVFRTLPVERRLDAMFELCKNVLIGATAPSAPLAEWSRRMLAGDDGPEVWRDMIVSGVAAKVPYLAADAHERVEALIFEYGHTVAHWLEMGGAVRSHGAAVGLGMVAAAMVAEARGLPSLDRHRALLSDLLSRVEVGPLPPAGHLARDRKRSSSSRPGDVPVLLSDGTRCVPAPDGQPLWRVPQAELYEAAAAACRWAR
jgi:3-dehydroquinate synthetase